MPVETLGEALSYGWRVTARCAAGKQDGMHRHKECVYRAELDMETLVWTRGRGFPISRLETPCAARCAQGNNHPDRIYSGDVGVAGGALCLHAAQC